MSKYLAFLLLALSVALTGCAGGGNQALTPVSGSPVTSNGSIGGKGLGRGVIPGYPVKLTPRPDGISTKASIEIKEVADKGGREGIITPRSRRSDSFINVNEQQVWAMTNPAGRWTWKVETPGVIDLRQSANGRNAYVTGVHRGWTKVTATSTRSQRYEVYAQVFGALDYIGVQSPEYRGGYDSFVAGSQEWHVGMGLQSPPDINSGSSLFIPSSWLSSDVRVQTIPRGIVRFEPTDISGFTWTATALQDGECDAIFRLYDRVCICHIVAKHIDPAKLEIRLISPVSPTIGADGNETFVVPYGNQLYLGMDWSYMGTLGVPDVDPVINASSGLNWTWTESHNLVLVPQRDGEYVCDINVAGKIKLIHIISP